MINGIIAGYLPFQIVYFTILIIFLRILGIGEMKIKIIYYGFLYNYRRVKAAITDKFSIFCNTLEQLEELLIF
jgi:hypothetical protein